MKIPTEKAAKQDFLRFIIDACTASQHARKELYEKRRRYFLFGQNEERKVKFNRLKSHIKLVSSFLFSPDGLVYNIAPPATADEGTIKKFLALQDEWNEDVRDSGLADNFSEALLWALNFDTMILKLGWNDTTKQVFAHVVEPSSYGVFREDTSDYSTQVAMNHTFLLDYDEAVTRLKKAGLESEIDNLSIEGASEESGLPPAMQQMIITATGGENLSGNILGQVNPDYEAQPQFRGTNLAPMVRFHETWIWDTDAEDWRIFHSLDGPVMLSDSADTIKDILKGQKDTAKFDSKTNWFLEKETPFIPIVPYMLYNYFFGDCHQEDIIPLQDWSNERLEQIDELLRQNVDPAKAFIGFQGLTDEKMGAWGDEGTYVADAMPGAKAEEFRPPLPEDIFREFNEIGGFMMEASGLTESVAGKSTGGARGGAQQKQMNITGGGQIRKVALGLEKYLIRMADIGLKLKMKNDDTKIRLDDGTEFVAAQLDEKFSIKVAGHSHSPLFTKETEEMAILLKKFGAVDNEWLVRLINPPERENLLHSLRIRSKAEAEYKAAHPEEAQHKGKKK